MTSTGLDWLTEFPFKKRGRYHISSTRVGRLRGSPEQEVAAKPRGLWYACGREWVGWAETAGWLEEVNYLYEVLPGPGVLRLRSLGELDAFSDWYGTFPPGFPEEFKDGPFEAIDWREVARRYTGVEICPYQRDRRMELAWYYTWDVASGCLWSPGRHRIRLVAQRPRHSHRIVLPDIPKKNR